ncbi:hypothetical protein DVQ04_07940 [Yersinia enterocolitica]|nr:hypothetical protein [Yersinia enterocolitica]
MAFSNVHYVSIYQTVTSLTYVFVLLAFRPLLSQNRSHIALSRSHIALSRSHIALSRSHIALSRSHIAPNYSQPACSVLSRAAKFSLPYFYQ